jgi:hypothetical protein
MIKIDNYERIESKNGTVYRKYVGNSCEFAREHTNLIEGGIKKLIGEIVEVDGKQVKVIDARIGKYCNITEYNYYAELLTEDI